MEGTPCPVIFECNDTALSLAYTTVYGACPLRVNGGCIGIANYIRSIQNTRIPFSYTPGERFKVVGSQYINQLKNLTIQKTFHDLLKNAGYDFSISPFKLQKWDSDSNKWRQLTIDCQIVAAAFFVYLEKNPSSTFIDPIHQETVMAFRTARVTKNGKSYIEVTPLLKNGDHEEGLCLSIKSDVSFPALKFTSPAVIADPTDDFICPVCLGGPETHTEIVDNVDVVVKEKIFRTGCGNEEGHCFHRQCIEQWFSSQAPNPSNGKKPSCPICKTTIAHFL